MKDIKIFVNHIKQFSLNFVANHNLSPNNRHNRKFIMLNWPRNNPSIQIHIKAHIDPHPTITTIDFRTYFCKTQPKPPDKNAIWLPILNHITRPTYWNHFPRPKSLSKLSKKPMHTLEGPPSQSQSRLSTHKRKGTPRTCPREIYNHPT